MFTSFSKKLFYALLLLSPVLALEWHAYHSDLSGEARAVRSCLDQVEKPKIIAIGDSTLASFRGHGLEEQRKFSIANCALSGSIALEWYLVLHQLLQKGTRPDAIFVSAAYLNNFRNDGHGQHMRFLPFFLDLSTTLRLLDFRLLDLGEIPALLMARVSHAFHHRGLIRQRLFWRYLRDSAQIEEMARAARKQELRENDAMTVLSWKLVQGLARDHGIPIIFSMAPVPSPAANDYFTRIQQKGFFELCRKLGMNCMQAAPIPDDYFEGTQMGAHIHPKNAGKIYELIAEYVNFSGSTAGGFRKTKAPLSRGKPLHRRN